MSSEAILRMEGITKTFPGVAALTDVNLSVRRGEIHAICGENGAGKSTLMKVLSGVYPHGTYTGQIVYQGEEQAFRDINSSESAGIVMDWDMLEPRKRKLLWENAVRFYARAAV